MDKQVQQLVAELGEMKARVAAMEDARRVPDVYFRVFDAEIDGSGTDGTKHTWHEVIDDGGTLVTFGERVCTDATHVSAAIETNGWKFVPATMRVRMIETEDTDGSRYEFVVAIPAPPFDGNDYSLCFNGTDKKLEWEEIGPCVSG